MSGNNVKKLCNYMYDCTRQAIKSSGFNNLSSNKDNKIVITDLTEFQGDNKEIIELMTKHALNGQTMNLLFSDIFIKGEKGKNKFYSPLLYSEAKLYREGDKIKLEKEENQSLNLGIIANLCEGEEEEIQNIIEQLSNIEACDLLTVMNGLLNMEGMEIIKQNAIILAALPNSTAGLLSELKQISELY